MGKWGGYGSGRISNYYLIIFGTVCWRPGWWEEWHYGIGIMREFWRCFIGSWTAITFTIWVIGWEDWWNGNRGVWIWSIPYPTETFLLWVWDGWWEKWVLYQWFISFFHQCITTVRVVGNKFCNQNSEIQKCLKLKLYSILSLKFSCLTKNLWNLPESTWCFLLILDRKILGNWERKNYIS